MTRTVLLVTYNRLNVTELDAKNIIGGVYEGVRAVTDAVAGLSEGKEMQEGIIYHFNGMGVSAMISPSEIMPDTEMGEARTQGWDPGQDTAMIERIEREEADDFHQMRLAASHSSVSSVCKSEEIVSAARQGADRADADPVDMNQWNLVAIHMNEDIAYNHTGKGIKIGIIDTGIADHKDLNERVKGGVSFCADGDDFKYDFFGHGTYCAGIAAGRHGGIAQEADLFSIKVADAAGADPVVILAGLGWALRNRMNVVSISLAGPPDLRHIPAFANAVQALMEINCVVVASTGDSYDGGPHGDVGLPANTPGIIAVGGCDMGGVILNDTRIGSKGNPMTVVAPGANITTTSVNRNKPYASIRGSSAAAPHVAGLVALIQEKFPGITPLQVAGRILASAQKVKIRRNKEDVDFGEKLINCEAALSLY